MTVINQQELLDSFAGAEHILLKITNQLLEQGDRSLDALVQAIASESASQIKFAAHTFKGMVANFACPELTAICERVEAIAASGDPASRSAELAQHIAAIETAYATMKIELAAFKAQL